MNKRRRLLSSAISLSVIGTTLIASAAPAEAAALSPSWTRSVPGHFIESSPLAVQLDGGQLDIVVGNQDGRLYGLRGENGTDATGWPFNAGFPVESNPSAADTNFDGSVEIFAGAGREAVPYQDGAMYSITANGAQRWRFQGQDAHGRIAFHSTPVIGDVNGDAVPDVSAYGLGLLSWAFAENGLMLKNWPYYADDTTHAAPAFADIDGDGTGDYINGSEQAAGGPIDHHGGIIRAMRGDKSVIWEYKFDEINRRGPAVGDIDGDNIPEVVIGTGDYWAQNGGSRDVNKLFAFSRSGQLKWVRDLGAVTNATPALADITGDGRREVIYGTWSGRNGPKIWAFDGATGNPLPQFNNKSAPANILGQLTTADVNNDGRQDIIANTGTGVFIYDGATGNELYRMRAGVTAFQNSALVTDLDSNGDLEIVVAGYDPFGAGSVFRFDLPSQARFGNAGWHMSGADNRRTNAVAPAPVGQNLCAAAPGDGYRMIANDGGVFGYCNAPFHGSAGGIKLAQPIVGGTARPQNDGYWLVASDGGIFAYGAAPFRGSTGNIRLAQPIVGMTPTPDGNGYWLVASDGGIFAYGNAGFFGSTGSIRLAQPIVGMTAAPDGRGYWLVARDGGIFAFGSARFFGSTGSIRLAQPIVGMASTQSGNGYWLVAADGGIFAYGDAPFHGSTGHIRLASPILGMTRAKGGNGYRMVAADGGVFSFGAPFLGSTGRVQINRPIIGMMN